MKDIHARAPIDSTAARVTSQAPDYQLTEMKTESSWDSELPIAVSSLPRFVDDLTGCKLGRLIAIGYHSTRRSGQKKKLVHHKWVMRCACGRYTVRTDKAIKAQSDPDHCCGHCNYMSIVKKRYNRERGL